MKPVTVVVAVPDLITSAPLLNSLRTHFRVVVPAVALGEIRPTVLKNRADVLVVDLEAVPVPEVTALVKDFAPLSVVCIHRLADDAMWTSSLAAGALDCCHPSDVRGIVMAISREGKFAQGHAA